MRILIVEDEVLIAMGLVWELEHAGHDIIGPATSAVDAIALARAQRPELALLDIDLQQRGDGIELAKQMREMDIPAVFVSGRSSEAYRNSDLVVGYISKPYNPEDVALSIKILDAVMHGGKPPPRSIPSVLELFH